MKTVNIYIETTIKSPIVKDGKYASALVFTRSNGEEAYRVMSGEECESTYNRLTLIAIIKSLQKLKEQCHVVIHTDNAYIKIFQNKERRRSGGDPSGKKPQARKSKIKNYGKCTLRKRRNTKRNFAFAPAMIIRDC